VGLVSAKDNNSVDYNISRFENSSWGNLSSPKSDYNIWGYTDIDYNFSTKLNATTLNAANNTTEIVFYWKCSGSIPTSDPLNYSIVHINDITNNTTTWNHTHNWSESGTYNVAAGIFQNNSPVNASYWAPIMIRKNTIIEVQNFSMIDENNNQVSNFSVNNEPSNLSPYTAPSKREYYCVYAKETQHFSAKINAILNNEQSHKTGINQSEADIRAINETTTEVHWNDSSVDSNFYDYNKLKDVNISKNTYQWDENFTHRWDNQGEKSVTVRNYHWDLLSGNQMSSKDFNVNILVIRDPKNFVSYSGSLPFISFLIEPFSNLQNLGIFLVATALMILFFTYTKNRVPVTISLFGLKPFYLKSVDSFIGIFTFVAGMYLYFIFGRCPWDIPIVSYSEWLKNKYFGVLHYEYVTLKFPYLSILLGIVCVVVLSSIIYRIGAPFLKRDLKSGEIFRGKEILARFNMLRISILLKRKH
jgi:hypothetical protein